MDQLESLEKSPIAVIYKLKGKKVHVRFKNNNGIEGILLHIDAKMNLVLDNAYEIDKTRRSRVKVNKIFIKFSSILLTYPIE